MLLFLKLNSSTPGKPLERLLGFCCSEASNLRWGVYVGGF
ncbi:hypothetical protein C4K35_3610 [Pseudomonas chlororaphis subsp. piscium]|nr:hypothetical protein C4K35_3610 [Pseudomonas chlororaphis subsp. piscium]AZC57765.1 hypothetical protein C4K34_3602 [Pseudomonas chlororaphis subsp. piscium]AZC76481.1 hypothetical protein C4K31_3580 [Pseudomonas chlororaphis subsp. piscium]AZC89907.1 hypothetical protein C4K29_3608 [Pseudomonas chlororaphis subsp. piscium]AZC96278.1 hypothetical protein C4K28_3552 [Pseudomonas chlororaphis subsp. piscium]